MVPAHPRAMTDDIPSDRVRETIETLTGERTEDAVELLVVGDRSVWLVVDPDGLENGDPMIDLFRALEAIPEIETLYVARADTMESGTEYAP